MTNPRELHWPALSLILGAFAAFTAANLIHNNFGLDSAIAPAALFVGLMLWRRRRVFLMGAALLIALPAFLFLELAALTNPAETVPFFNHLALLAAGVLAVASAVVALIPTRRTALQFES